MSIYGFRTYSSQTSLQKAYARFLRDTLPQFYSNIINNSLVAPSNFFLLSFTSLNHKLIVIKLERCNEFITLIRKKVDNA